MLIGLNDVARTSIGECDMETIRAGLSVSSPKAFLKSLSAYSEAAAAVVHVGRALGAHQEGLTHRQVDLPRLGDLEPMTAAERRVLDGLRGRPVDEYTGRVRRLVALTRANGIEPVLITQPLLVGEGTDDVTGVDLARVRTAPRQSGALYWARVELFNEGTRRVAREMDVLLVDLARRLPKSSRLFYDFTHFTPAGAEAVAAILFESLTPVLRERFPSHRKAGGP
jgi:hypothetical protein